MITFLDPTFPNRLPTLGETLDFVVSTGKANFTMSLRFESGRMETIYQDGIVGVGYEVKVDDDNETFHVRRVGGWPLGRFSLPMTEQDTDATTDPSWDIVYEKDLRTLSSAVFSTASEYKTVTIDGMPWVSHIAGAGGRTESIAGAGLKLTANAGSAKSSLNPHLGTLLMLDTALWPGLDRTKEIGLAVRFAGATDTDYSDASSDLGVAVYSGVRSAGLGGNGADVFQARGFFGGTAPLSSLTIELLMNMTSVLSSSMKTSEIPSDTYKGWAMAASVCPYNVAVQRPFRSNMRSFWYNYDYETRGDHVNVSSLRPGATINGTGTGQNADWMLGFYVGARGLNAQSITISHIRLLTRDA